MRGAVVEIMRELRRQLDCAFAEDTAAPGSGWTHLVPSSGHCAVVAMTVMEMFGGEYVSAKPGGVSHWFNRITIAEWTYDIDLTGDQFGRAAVQVSERSGRLFDDTRVREYAHLNSETIDRFVRFIGRIP